MNLLFKDSARPWTPDVIRGQMLALWLDAADSSTITLNGSNVSAWADKSGNERHATQSNASVQPAYTTTGFNSRPSVQFNQKYLENATAQFPLISRSVFVVVNETERVANAGLLSIKPASGNDWNRIDGVGIAVGDNSSTQFGINGSTPTPYILAATPSLSAFGQFCEIKQAGTGTLYKNGSSLTSDVSFTEFNELSSGGYYIGARFLTSVNYTTTGLKGDIAEIIYTSSTLSTINRQKLEGYLAWKWGLQTNLPTDHPYRYHRPMR